MGQAAHSPVGASSMYRWAKCPGSVRLSENIPDVETPESKEGTIAHDIAAKILEGRFPREAEQAPQEMMDAVWEYVNLVLDEAKQEGVYSLFVEERFDLSSIHPNLFGTADAVIYNGQSKVLKVFDYKHGAGVAVEVEDNMQLKYYGLGALFKAQNPVDTVELIIVQPRCFHPKGTVRRWSLSATELLDFSFEIKEAVLETEKEDAPLKTGSHCRFCKAAGVCPKLQEESLALAKKEFGPTIDYQPENLSKVLRMLDRVEAWAKSVRRFAYEEAERGRIPPGFKLVQKQARRKWDQEEKAVWHLTEKLKVPKEDIYDVKLKSPAKIDKLLNVSGRYAMEKYTKKESSGLTLVPHWDPRQGVNPVLFEPVKKEETKEKGVVIDE